MNACPCALLEVWVHERRARHSLTRDQRRKADHARLVVFAPQIDRLHSLEGLEEVRYVASNWPFAIPNLSSRSSPEQHFAIALPVSFHCFKVACPLHWNGLICYIRSCTLRH